MFRLFFFSLPGVGLSSEVFDWDESSIAKPVPGRAPIVDAEAEADRSTGSGFTLFSDRTRCESIAMVRAQPEDLPSLNWSIESPFRWRLDPDPDSGVTGDTANVGICGCTASRSRTVKVEPRPGAGGVLTWCDAGEWCATSTVGLCGVLFFSPCPWQQAKHQKQKQQEQRHAMKVRVTGTDGNEGDDAPSGPRSPARPWTS